MMQGEWEAHQDISLCRDGIKYQPLLSFISQLTHFVISVITLPLHSLLDSLIIVFLRGNKNLSVVLLASIKDIRFDYFGNFKVKKV